MLRRSTLVVALCSITVAPAGGDVGTLADAALRQYCSDAADSNHPGRATIDQPILIDEFASLGETRLILAYDPETPDPSGRGRVSANVRLFRDDGSSRNLGQLKAVQDRVSGATVAMKTIAEGLGPGDMLRWNFRLTNFHGVDEGQCFFVGGGIAPPPEPCGPYPDRTTSEYILPYAAGEASVISQGNCALGSHQGVARHAYDFAMPVRTELIAVRAGTVVGIDDIHPEGTGLGEHDKHPLHRARRRHLQPLRPHRAGRGARRPQPESGAGSAGRTQRQRRVHQWPSPSAPPDPVLSGPHSVRHPARQLLQHEGPSARAQDRAGLSSALIAQGCGTIAIVLMLTRASSVPTRLSPSSSLFVPWVEGLEPGLVRP